MSIVIWIVMIGCITGDYTDAGVKSGARGEETSVTPQLFKARREKFIKSIEPTSIAFFYSSPVRNRNHDTEYRYRQDDNLFYLTGIEEPDCILVLIPAGRQIPSRGDTLAIPAVKEILFYSPRTERELINDGPGLTDDILKKQYGIVSPLPMSDFSRILGSLVEKAEVMYFPFFPDDLTGQISEYLRPLRLLVPSISQKIAIKDPTPLLAEMRAIKSTEESGLIRKAAEITAIAQVQAIMSIEPGMYEYEVQALLEYIFARSGAESYAFPSIVGSGENSFFLHSMVNRRMMSDGDLVIIDAGAEYHGYAADVSRTVPVNGRFSDPQREIYEIVLNAQEEAIRTIKPGALIQDYQKKADEIITRGLVSLGILSGNIDSLITAQAYVKYTCHGIGHPVGLCVHDVAPKSGRLEPGMVVTVEPGLYIRREMEGVDPKYFNIGVRIEDTILVTKDGCENLSAGVPRNVLELERLMKKRGLGNEPLD
jgi:Xaa-Pro aminopeptidase